jgi:hypothetical protein
MTVTPTLIVAIYAAVLSTLVFLWQIIVYLRDGARLKVSASSNMQMIDDNGLQPKKYIVVNAVNVGTADTTITHVVAFTFANRLQYWRRKQRKAFIVNHASHAQPIPYVLEVGRQFMSLASQTSEMEELSRTDLLYIGVIHASGAKPVFARVKPIEPPKPDAEVPPENTLPQGTGNRRPT